MKKIVSFLIALILITAVFPQIISGAEDWDNCDHEYESVVENGYIRFEPRGSSGHARYHRVFLRCKKCYLHEGLLPERVYLNGGATVPHSYENIGGAFSKEYKRINSMQHVYYYKQKVKCYYCDYETTLSFSITQNHTFKNGKCTQCGSKQ